MTTFKDNTSTSKPAA